MLLRSSSTPVLGSLLPSLSESPCCNTYSENNPTVKHPPTLVHQNYHKALFCQSGSLNLTSYSANSSPISPFIADQDPQNGFRRAQSVGNLEDLTSAYNDNRSETQSLDKSPQNVFPPRPNCLMLQTIPSFSCFNFKNGRGEEDEEEEEEDDDDDDDIQVEDQRHELEENGGNLDWGSAERVMSMSLQVDGFLQNNATNSMVLTKEVTSSRNGTFDVCVGDEKEMYLARGFGIDGFGGGNKGSGGGGGGGGDYNPAGLGGGGGDRHKVEEYYKKMVEENPANPLFLRNYAHFLYQTKRDLLGADEYYSRAILVDPRDGEVLSKYAEVVWELHRDQDRASSYFERAVQASPEDSHVRAAYANFLWETEDDDNSCKAQRDFEGLPPSFHEGAMASIGALKV